MPLKPDPSITHSWVIDWFRDYNTRPTDTNPSSSWAFRAKVQRARRWSENLGRPVYFAEFGCYYKADPGSRVTLYQAIRKVMDDEGLGWAMWDWKAGFHYIKNGQPDPPGMREAIFPPIQLRSQTGGTIEFDGAVGKIYLVEKALSLTPPVSWKPVSTQTLASPKFLFRDLDLNVDAGYYRVRWLK